jgi:RimJ/RimL family protein N-acetyltransferase
VELTLRPPGDGDADLLFGWMRDPESVALAAFTAEDPDDRAAFDAWLARNLARPDVRHLMIVADGATVGSISSFVIEGDRELSYWIDRAHWGRGIASAALAAFLADETERPLSARTASHNTGSARVLERAGFRVVATERGFAPGVGAEIDEHVYRLD